MSVGRKIKRTIKGGVKTLSSAYGALVPATRGASRILTYHSVGRRDHEMNVTLEVFTAQMEWLAEHVQVIPLAEAAGGRPGVAITFDDGYVDNLTNAAPVLAQLGMTATVFAVSGRLGGMLDHDRGRDHSTLMTPQQLTELEGAGLQVGAHTMTHPRLSSLEKEEQRREIVQSAEQLEDYLGHPVEAFAYPFGSALDYDDTSRELVRAAGFSHAASNRYGINEPPTQRWELRRIWIDATDSFRSFQAKVEGRLDSLALLETSGAIRARRMLNAVLRPD